MNKFDEELTAASMIAVRALKRAIESLMHEDAAHLASVVLRLEQTRKSRAMAEPCPIDTPIG